MRKRAAKMAISMATAASMVGVAGMPVITRAAEPTSRSQVSRDQHKRALHVFHQALKAADKKYQSGKVAAEHAYQQTLAHTKNKLERHAAWEIRNTTLKELESTLHSERKEARDTFHQDILG